MSFRIASGRVRKSRTSTFSDGRILMVEELILIKLGGSLLTDKRGVDEARPEVIDRLAREIAAALPTLGEQGKGLIVGHGSGSFGHVAAAQSGLGSAQTGTPDRGTPDRRPPSRDGISLTQDAAARLHRLLFSALAMAGAAPYSQVPSSFLVARRGRPARGQVDALLRAVDLGLVPLVYGDVVMDEAWGASIASTEAVLFYLLRRLRRLGRRVERLLWLGETDGIYDLAGRTLPRVTSDNYRQTLQAIRRPVGTDVTGGMLLRLKTAWTLARAGVDSWILNGTVPGVLESALKGEETVVGTLISHR